ncbi:MAG TPA: LacI family DNA-binding transcriptional regulator [Pseudolysinimonas sp.]|jgi:DNA-binding LacI/PurR family transcriptional regulator
MTDEGEQPRAAKRARSGGTRGPGIADVARHAGVSMMSVSRVLNDKPGVGAEARGRVLEAMRELGFQPNSLARALRTGRPTTIGVVCLDTTLYGPAVTLFGVEHAARAAGYAVNVVSLSSITEQALAEAFVQLRAAPVAAVVIISPMSTSADALRDLPTDLPVVAIWAPSDVGISVAGVDHGKAAAAATDHLLSLGHRNVWHISGPPGWTGAEQRIQGWRDALLRVGLMPPEPIAGDWTARSGYEAGKRLLADPEVTAVFVANDQMALGLLHAARELGVEIPAQVSVVGYDDGPDSEFYAPPLTTIRQDFSALGAHAFRMAMEKLGGEPAIEENGPVSTELVLRETTGPAVRR